MDPTSPDRGAGRGTRFAIGIDTGGTFIDFVLRESDGGLKFHKQLADPADLAGCVMAGLSALARSHGVSLPALLADATVIAHGTTLATNATLTHTGAPTALLTTEGLRDALEMRRGIKEAVFDLHYRAPEPLIPRQHRIGVEERIGADGNVLKPLRPDAALAALDEAIRADGIRSVAICLMHAWINDAHERELKRRVRGAWPALDVICSHEVLPQAGFYDRVSTTAISAYTTPIMRTYLSELRRALAEAGFGGDLFVVTSAAGMMLPEDAIAQAARTVLSGPSSAPVVGVKLCREAGCSDAVVVDMGGTSFDVSLVADLAPRFVDGGTIGRLRVAVPMTDVRTIALGGGSIAWIDPGGLLRIGPQSAGATPGSACFGHGGDLPSITDADVVLGYLAPESFEGSGLRIQTELAHKALASLRQGGPVAAAIGVFRLAAAQMADCVQRTALEAGLDWRRLPLIVGGGAGPIHAASIGRELGAASLLIPESAATLCAVGALYLRPRHDAMRSLYQVLDLVRPASIIMLCESLADQVTRASHQPFSRLEIRYGAVLRYVGQVNAMMVAFDPQEIERHGIRYLRQSFESIHFRSSGFVIREGQLEILALRCTAYWEVGFAQVRSTPRSGHFEGPSRCRRAYDLVNDEFRNFPVWKVANLGVGTVVRPPALIEMAGTTSVVMDPYEAIIDADRTLRLNTLTS